MVRPADPARDAATCAAIYAPAVTRGFASFETEPPEPEEMAVRIGAAHLWLMADDAGYAYAGPFNERAGYDWSVSVAVYVAPGKQGRGIGRALYGALLPALEQRGFHWAMAGIALPNPGSEALHAAFGFERVALYRDIGFKDGAWHDVAWSQRALAPLETPPRRR